MKPNVRRIVFIVAAAALGTTFAAAARGLPAFGHYPGPYGDLLTQAAYYERHVTNAVTGTNFDLRALDTLGEESILFTAVAGALVLLRRVRQGTAGDQAPQFERVKPATDAITLGALLTLGLLIVYGVELLLHAPLTPGGGFQAGVVLATAALTGYFVTDVQALKRFTPHTLLAVSDGTGAAAFTAIGLIGVCLGGPFLFNFLPLGQRGALLSGGTIVAINLAVGLEVAAAFTLLFNEFLPEIAPSQEKDR